VTDQPPPMPGPPEKKKLSAAAWIAIGCGGLLLLATVVIGALMIFAGYFVNRVASDLQSQPVTTLARAIALANPDVELVEADEDARRATFRNTRTGETVVVDADDLEQGRISFETADGTVSVDASRRDTAVDLQVTDGDETTVISGGAGADAASQVPAWVPRYPGAGVEGALTSQGSRGERGSLTLRTTDSFDAVVAFYRGALGAAGYEIETSTFSAEGRSQTSLSGRRAHPPGSLTVIVSDGDGDGRAIVVTYEAPGSE